MRQHRLSCGCGVMSGLRGTQLYTQALPANVTLIEEKAILYSTPDVPTQATACRLRFLHQNWPRGSLRSAQLAS